MWLSEARRILLNWTSNIFVVWRVQLSNQVYHPTAMNSSTDGRFYNNASYICLFFKQLCFFSINQQELIFTFAWCEDPFPISKTPKYPVSCGAHRVSYELCSPCLLQDEINCTAMVEKPKPLLVKVIMGHQNKFVMIQDPLLVLLIQANGGGRGCFIHPIWKFS